MIVQSEWGEIRSIASVRVSSTSLWGGTTLRNQLEHPPLSLSDERGGGKVFLFGQYLLCPSGRSDPADRAGYRGHEQQ
jgi:hypothetical protein